MHTCIACSKKKRHDFNTYSNSTNFQLYTKNKRTRNEKFFFSFFDFAVIANLNFLVNVKLAVFSFYVMFLLVELAGIFLTKWHPQVSYRK